MDHAAHSTTTSINRLAFSATVHCLTGCAIGEILGLGIATALGWADLPSVVLAIVLALTFGYALTIRLDGLFWGSLALALAIAGLVAYPVNRWLIARGRGHALVPGHH